MFISGHHADLLHKLFFYFLFFNFFSALVNTHTLTHLSPSPPALQLGIDPGAGAGAHH